MRKKNYKGRCEKRSVPKCEGICKTYDALVRKHRITKEKPLSEDQKNIRWAINKYVYSRKKHGLNTAYKLMLKEKYTDSNGVLAENIPSFNQFRYWYAKFSQ